MVLPPRVDGATSAAGGERRGTRAVAAPGRGVPGWVERLLAVPLPVKLIGASGLLLGVAGAAAALVHNRGAAADSIVVAGVASLVALGINIVLVALAVRPLRVLENTVDAVWRGDLDARVPESLLADRQIARLGRLFNTMLDGLAEDRARTRRLATELIRASDRERAAIARDLHGSTAQSLAAVVMQLAVAARTVEPQHGAALRARLEDVRLLATSVLEEVRLLAHTVHPHVLEELGLVAALRRLARESSDRGGATAAPECGCSTAGDGSRCDAGHLVKVEISAAPGADAGLSVEVASVLYRVAQEAVLNACRHGRPRQVDIGFWRTDRAACLEVSDDGSGFDPAVVSDADASGIGLFTMRERLALLDGSLRVTSQAGRGTWVLATVPVGSPRTTLTGGGES